MTTPSCFDTHSLSVSSQLRAAHHDAGVVRSLLYKLLSKHPSDLTLKHLDEILLALAKCRKGVMVVVEELEGAVGQEGGLIC